jgi:hypothetical protein
MGPRQAIAYIVRRLVPTCSSLFTIRSLPAAYARPARAWAIRRQATAVAAERRRRAGLLAEIARCRQRRA